MGTFKLIRAENDLDVRSRGASLNHRLVCMYSVGLARDCI